MPGNEKENLKLNIKIMNSVKIEKKFFSSKKEAKNVATHYRQNAKRNNIILLKIEILDACDFIGSDFFRKNKSYYNNHFRKLRSPEKGQYIIIIHYNHNVVEVKKPLALKKKIIKASKTKSTSSKFKILQLTGSQKKHLAAKSFGFVSNNPMRAFRFRYRVAMSIRKLRSCPISFSPPGLYCLFAA